MTGLLTLLLLVPRPALSGAAVTHDASDGRWKVHYTLAGADALVHGATDVAPANGVPDDVDAVESGLTSVAGRWVDQVGMPAPLPDDGTGGDARVDVYLKLLPSGRGETVRDGPGAPAPVWIAIDPRTASVSSVRLAAAAGHEAHHAIQAAYAAAVTPWIAEASAAYVEHAGFSDGALAAETDAHHLAMLSHPEISLDTSDGTHEYDALVFIKFLVDKTRDPARLRQLWEALVTAGGDAVAAVTLLEKRPIAEVLADFAVWLLHDCAGDDGQRWDPAAAACHSSARASPKGLGAIPARRDLPLARLAAVLVSIPIDGCSPVDLRLEAYADLALASDEGTPLTLASPTTTLRLDGPGPSHVLSLASGAAPSPSLVLHADPVPSACSDGGASDATLSPTTPPPSGCRCDLRRAPPSAGALWLAAFVAAALIRRRRR